MQSFDNARVLATGWHISSQTPIDDRIVMLKYDDIRTLGPNDEDAFRYYDGLKIFVVENETEYIWKESIEGILSAPFTYPANVALNGVDYSNRTFNLVKSSFPPSITDINVFTTLPLANAAYINVNAISPYFPAKKAVITSGNTLPFPTLQGIVPFLNMKVLVKDQVNKTQNGDYKLTKLGNGTTEGWELTRISYTADGLYPRFWMIKDGPEAHKIFTQFNAELTTGQIGISGNIVFGLINQSIDTITVTHTELINTINSNGLIPQASYTITDFRTIYDQPDFNLDGTPKINPTVKTGPLRPIAVVASSTNTLALEAYDLTHPKDIIHYIPQFTTPVTNTVTKGRIIKRIDEFNNESDFDHRNVLFKRYLDEYGDFGEYRDTGEAYQEFLALTLSDPDQAHNYLGDTFSYFINNETIAIDYLFDLPNIVTNIYGGEVVKNNKFYGYVMNITLPTSSKNNSIAGPCINYYSSRIQNNEFGSIINVNSRNQFDGNKISELRDLNINGGPITYNNIRVLADLNGEITIKDSNIGAIENNQIDNQPALGSSSLPFLEIASSTIQIFRFNTIKTKLRITNSNVNSFTHNIFSYTFGFNLYFTHNTFNALTGNYFFNHFANNTGLQLSDSAFKGLTSYNNFGPAIDNCEFGANFGSSDPTNKPFLEFNEVIGLENTHIQPTGNTFMGTCSTVKFGRNCAGNIFKGNLTDLIFGDNLVNNDFENFLTVDPDTFGSIDFTNEYELYETFKTRLFALQKSHKFNYSIGNKYLNSSLSQYVFYRSELINQTKTNFFIDKYPLNNNTLYIWQKTPSLLGATNGGFDQITKNTRLINEGYNEPSAALPALIGRITDGNKRENEGLRLWLPTLDELQIIYNNRVALGITTTGKIWSSSEYDATRAWAINFSTGVASFELKTLTFNFIPIATKTYDYAIHLEYADEFGAKITKVL